MARYDVGKLERKMLELGWPVLELSRKSGVPESTIRLIYKVRSGHPENLKKLAKALHIRFSSLVIDSQDEAVSA